MYIKVKRTGRKYGAPRYDNKNKSISKKNKFR